MGVRETVRRGYPYVPVGWPWYLGTLVPMIRLCIVIAWGVWDLAARRQERRWVLGAAALIVSVTLGTVARAQVSV